VELAQTLAGAVMTAVGCGMMGMLCVPVTEPQEVVTVTERSTFPLAAEVKVSTFVVAPETTVPPAMVHAYVAPLCKGTDAVAVLPAQTLGGALIVASGPVTAMLTLFVTLPQLLVTIRERPIGPPAPASKVIVSVVVDDVIVPLMIDQL
jgi:hypothetical protein